MTPTVRLRVASAGMWLSAGLNVAIVAMDLARGNYRGAALQSIVLVGISAWQWLAPKVEAMLDAKLGEARAQQQMAEIALQEISRLKTAGDLRVDMNVTGRIKARADGVH